MDHLLKNEIYTCSLHEFLPVETDRYYMVYAPLSTMALLASAQDVEAITGFLGNPNGDESLKEIVNALTDKSISSDSLSQRIKDITGFVNLSILLNNKCNFQCNYCYSAEGRSNTQLDEKKLHGTIDYFIDKQRINVPKLSITFLGGGEPMLSWELIYSAVLHAEKRASCEGFGLRFKIVTNGSVLSDEMIDFMLKHRIEIVVSYEILEDIQNLQRKHFALVRDNIRKLSECGAMISVNSVITPDNVNRQVEMVEVAAETFPRIDYLSFEPCKELNDKATHIIDEKFYRDFTTGFLQAHQTAKEKNIELSCSLLRNVDCVVERFCAGEFGICADGSITICPCISAPNMPDYQHYIYGNIDEQGTVRIDNVRLENLLSEDVHSYSKCRHCFAKWNCGGDCIHLNRLSSEENKNIRCDFIRRFTKQVLWNRLKTQYEDEYRMPVINILQQANTKN
jgi:radical SAM protein with 4Fe4S-binding SPASM domain